MANSRKQPEKKGRQRRSFGAIRKLPSKRFQASYIHPDTGQRVSAPDTFETATDADTWLAIVRADLATGRNRPDTPKRRTMTLAVFAEGWLAQLDRAERTKYTYRTTLDREILPTLGNKPLTALTERIVRNWWADLPADKPSKRAQAYRVLRTVLNAAIEAGEITQNPCQIKGAATSKTKRQPELVSADEVGALAGAMTPGRGIGVYLGALAALRAGEILGLQRQDIDLQRRVIHVRRSVGGGTPGVGREGPTKSEASRREVAVPTFLADALAVHLASIGPERDAWLFPSPQKPGAPLSYLAYSADFTRAAEAIGRPGLRLHDLRHSGATMAARSGATLRELMGRLGHSTPHTAMRYQHATAERDRAIADALGEQWGGRSSTD